MNKGEIDKLCLIEIMMEINAPIGRMCRTAFGTNIDLMYTVLFY